MTKFHILKYHVQYSKNNNKPKIIIERTDKVLRLLYSPVSFVNVYTIL